jgi:hypothetical protein
MRNSLAMRRAKSRGGIHEVHLRLDPHQAQDGPARLSFAPREGQLMSVFSQARVR